MRLGAFQPATEADNSGRGPLGLHAAKVVSLSNGDSLVPEEVVRRDKVEVEVGDGKGEGVWTWTE